MDWVTKVTSSALLLAEAVGIARVFSTRVRRDVYRSQILRVLIMFYCIGISYLQQSITGKGGQSTEKGAQGGDTSHHAAVDAAHPEKISEFLRHQNRSMTEEDGK